MYSGILKTGRKQPMGRTFRSCRVLIKGGGEMASGIAVRLYRAGFREILLLETPAPVAVRRTVSFSEAVYEGEQRVEGVPARLARDPDGIFSLWRREVIAVTVDPQWKCLPLFHPDVSIDAILAKRNLGTALSDAPLVLALGPGFTAGADAHAVIETRRGHNLGRIYRKGAAEADTGTPGAICGYTLERVLRSPEAGAVFSSRRIGDAVRTGETVLSVNGVPVTARIDGVVRGLIHPGIMAPAGIKLGDIDPRGKAEYCQTVSEKARALGGAALEAICAHLSGLGDRGKRGNPPGTFISR
jgi:xanthine dehydrogenase accessory factor